MLDHDGVRRTARALRGAGPEAILQWATGVFAAGRVALCTSLQVDSLVLLDMAVRIAPSIRILTLDTGRLPEETYSLIDTVRERYAVGIEVVVPDTNELQDLVRQHGLNPFYKSVDLRLACCDVRKGRPLARALQGLDAWITGVRREQSSTRAQVEVIELDHEHPGVIKLNPLAHWTDDQVWAYARAHDVPLHPLYAHGYTSIGCAPCTRPIGPGEDVRAGRWWWEHSDVPKECGLHMNMRGPWVQDRAGGA